MIPETRETVEECIQALQSYMRNELSPESINNKNIAESVEDRLTLTASDWFTKRGIAMAADDYRNMAKEAVRRYVHNWNGKVQGEDDRGHRLGKRSK